MSDKPISPLRRRMIEDMTVRNFVEKTRNDYIRHVRTFTTFLGRAPDTAAPEDLRLFQLHQTQTGVGASGINGSVAALRFFFTVTLDRPEMARHLTFVRKPRKIPVILSLEEIARLLEAAPGPKYKAALSAAYGAGLPGHGNQGGRKKLERRFCVIGKRYNDLVKPQRDPHLNLTGQGYRAASTGQEQGENYRRLHAKRRCFVRHNSGRMFA
jgi:hypothetical protein